MHFLLTCPHYSYTAFTRYPSSRGRLASWGRLGPRIIEHCVYTCSSSRIRLGLRGNMWPITTMLRESDDVCKQHFARSRTEQLKFEIELKAGSSRNNLLFFSFIFVWDNSERSPSNIFSANYPQIFYEQNINVPPTSIPQIHNHNNKFENDLEM